MDFEILGDVSPLNRVYQLQCSELSVMEAFNSAIYNTIKTGDIDILQESNDDISDIVNQSLDNSTVMEAYTYCTKVVPSYTAFIMKHSKRVDMIPKDHIDFDISGYYFSVLDSSRVDFTEFEKIIDEYIPFAESVLKIAAGVLPDTTHIQYLDDYMDEDVLSGIRGEILGNGRKIYNMDFMDTVRKFYRSGMNRTEIIHIDKKYVTDNIMKSVKVIQKDFECTKKELKYLDSLFSKSLKLIDATRKECSNTVDPTMDELALCINLLDQKYSQVVFLENTIRVILVERIRALNDQMSQNVEIYKRCLSIISGDSVSKVVECMEINPLIEGTDYVEVALEDIIFRQANYMDIMESRYTAEIDFVTGCLENGFTNPVMELNLSGVYQVLKDNFIKFIDKIISVVRGKLVEYNKKYIPWLEDVGEQTIVAKAQNMKSVTMAPYYEGNDLAKDLRDIQSAITTASRNTDKTNLSFTKTFVNNMDTQEKYEAGRGDLSGYLKNYFRFGEKNAKSVKKVDVSGRDLASKIPVMFKYIMQYEKNVRSLDGLTRTLENAVQNMANSKVMDSFSYLQLEDRPISQTDLVLLEGCQILFEEVVNTNKDDKSGKVVNDKGEVESPTKVETSEQKEREEAKEKGEKPASSSKYTSTFQNFFQLTISAYITAMEERYISYINALCQLAGGRPKIDKNGKYIPREDDKKEEPVKDSTLPINFYNKPSEMKGLSLYQ